MESSEKKQPSVAREETPGRNLKAEMLEKYKQKLKTLSLGNLIEEVFLYQGERSDSLNFLCHRAALDEINLREKRLNALWERQQEIDALNAEPYGHGPLCLCKECWED